MKRAKMMKKTVNARVPSRVRGVRREVRAEAGTVTANATGTRKVRPVRSQRG